jgi:DNA-binding MarR family transcriptional regulator
MEWLSDEEQSAWRPFVGLLFRFPALLDAQLQKDAGISHFEYMVLSSLSEAPDRALRMSQLAAMASGSVSRLSHVVSRLEAKGWVRREPSPGDGRFISAVLTEPGWQKVVETAPGHVAAVRRLLIDTLTPAELGSLGEISAKILKAQGFNPLSRTVRALRPHRPPKQAADFNRIAATFGTRKELPITSCRRISRRAARNVTALA